MTCVEESSLERLLSALDVAGFVRYEIDSRTIGCKSTLLAALTKGFELEVEGELDSWDAAADLIWQRLMEQNGNKCALIWHNAHLSLADNLQLVFDAIELLVGVAETAAKHPPDNGCQTVVFRIFLAGTGSNFPSFP